MTKTLVIQSHRSPLPADWLSLCIDSVKTWASQHGFDYRFIDDQLFDYVSADILDRTKQQRVIATDLARLKAIQDSLNQDYDSVVWCDADFLIFNPQQFLLPETPYALGREVWIQENTSNPKKLSVHTKVHNAFLMFRKGNLFLDFYTDTAERLLLINQGPVPPQFIGPKLLTALHNIAQCPVLETAGMFSPLVIQAIAHGEGPALSLFNQHSPKPPYAANLCHSLNQQGECSNEEIDRCITTLLSKKTLPACAA